MHLLRSPKYRRRAGLIIANSFNSLLVPVFGIVVSLLVVRLTSVELWGMFVEVMIWAQLAAMVVGWGNKEFLLRAFSRQPAQMAVRWQSSLVTRSALLLPAGLGLAFQIRDDMLDVEGDEAVFGKPIGSDREEGKVTFVDVLGLEGCRTAVEECTRRAEEAILSWPDHDFLLTLAHSLEERKK